MDNQALKTYIEKLINRGSSATELARKCGISDTAMSQFRSGKYGANEDSIAEKIASGLNYYENAWNVVESVQLPAGTHRVRGSQTESQMDVHIFPIRQWEDSIPHRPL